MKKFVAILAAALTVGSATIALAGGLPGTGVIGSNHDMTFKFPATKDALGRVCIYCHTPHNTIKDDAGLNNYPLWNHTLPDTSGWQTYQWATPLNSTLDPTVAGDVLAGPSRLCMTCHDGVINADQHGKSLAQAGANPLSGDRAIGGGNKDLSNDHPIGFSWDAALSARNITIGGVLNKEIADKTDRFVSSRAASATAGTYDSLTRNGKRAIGDVLYLGDVMTCASCHDVHNKDNVKPSVQTGAGVGANYFLWADENQSLICISCHYK